MHTNIREVCTLQYQQSIGDLVVEILPATGEAQARFPTNARVIVDQGTAEQCSPIMVAICAKATYFLRN